jgi:hypothetical protein
MGWEILISEDYEERFKKLGVHHFRVKVVNTFLKSNFRNTPSITNEASF